MCKSVAYHIYRRHCANASSHSLSVALCLLLCCLVVATSHVHVFSFRRIYVVLFVLLFLLPGVFVFVHCSLLDLFVFVFGAMRQPLQTLYVTQSVWILPLCSCKACWHRIRDACHIIACPQYCHYDRQDFFRSGLKRVLCLPLALFSISMLHLHPLPSFGLFSQLLHSALSELYRIFSTPLKSRRDRAFRLYRFDPIVDCLVTRMVWKSPCHAGILCYAMLSY